MNCRTATIGILLLLTACSPNNSTPAKPFEKSRDALNNASAVDAVQQQQAEAQRKVIEQQTQ